MRPVWALSGHGSFHPVYRGYQQKAIVQEMRIEHDLTLIFR
jgi:hypothetical protein